MIAIVGKPNVGKSTFFSALTMKTVDIGNYPFTTIEPNEGVAYVRHEEPSFQLNLKANPKTKAMMENRINQAELISFDEVKLPSSLIIVLLFGKALKATSLFSL